MTPKTMALASRLLLALVALPLAAPGVEVLMGFV